MVKDIRDAAIKEYGFGGKFNPVDFKIYQNKQAWEEKKDR
jgi:hypothetical protein